LRKTPGGEWEYSTEKPTDPYEPIITEEQVTAELGPSVSPERARGFVEGWLREPPPERPQAEIDPSRRHVGLTFGPERPGPSLGEGTRVHLPGQYTPFDRRKIEKLYDERSKIATDPELTEDERQSFLDDVDERISMVPPVSPQMKEPTAQEQFDASLVKAPDGTPGTFNPRDGKFSPLTPAGDDQQTQIQDLAFKIFMAQDDEAKNIGIAETQARRFIIGREVNDIPGVFDAVWNDMMSKLYEDNWGKISREKMDEKLIEYRNMAMGMGVPQQVATYDFMQKWKEETKKKRTWVWVPSFPKEYEKRLTKPTAAPPVGGAKAQPAPEAQPFAAVGGVEVPVGGGPRGSVTVGGKTVRTGNVIVQDKSGKKFFLPASQLNDALAKGYKLVE